MTAIDDAVEKLYDSLTEKAKEASDKEWEKWSASLKEMLATRLSDADTRETMTQICETTFKAGFVEGYLGSVVDGLKNVANERDVRQLPVQD